MVLLSTCAASSPSPTLINRGSTRGGECIDRILARLPYAVPNDTPQTEVFQPAHHSCRVGTYSPPQEPPLPRPKTRHHTGATPLSAATLDTASHGNKQAKKKKNEKKRAHPPWAPPCPVLRENPTRSSGGRVSAMAATSPPLKVATASAAAVATQTRAGCASLGKKRKSCGSHLRCEQRQQRQPWLPSRCRPCRRVCQPLAVATHSHWGCRQQ